MKRTVPEVPLSNTGMISSFFPSGETCGWYRSGLLKRTVRGMRGGSAVSGGEVFMAVHVEGGPLPDEFLGVVQVDEAGDDEDDDDDDDSDGADDAAEIPDGGDAAAAESTPQPQKRRGGGRRKRKDPPQIQDVLKRGQSLVVQVSKEPISTKGCRVTAQISLPGRFLVYMPYASRVGVSRKIEDEAERSRLRELGEKRNVATALNNVGEVLEKQGQADAAAT